MSVNELYNHPAPDELVTGRYEALATPSNFRGAMRYETPGIDWENDDSADILARTNGASDAETFGNIDQSGMTGYERAVVRGEDAKQDAMRVAYQAAVESGILPEIARQQVAAEFQKKIVKG